MAFQKTGRAPIIGVIDNHRPQCDEKDPHAWQGDVCRKCGTRANPPDKKLPADQRGS